jgi:hypothetical protein
MPRNVERVIEIGQLPQSHWERSPSVHGTEPQGVVPCASYTARRAGNWHPGPLWQGAVATPEFGWLRPPNSYALLSSRHGSLPPACTSIFEGGSYFFAHREVAQRYPEANDSFVEGFSRFLSRALIPVSTVTAIGS